MVRKDHFRIWPFVSIPKKPDPELAATDYAKWDRRQTSHENARTGTGVFWFSVIGLIYLWY